MLSLHNALKYLDGCVHRRGCSAATRLGKCAATRQDDGGASQNPQLLTLNVTPRFRASSVLGRLEPRTAIQQPRRGSAPRYVESAGDALQAVTNHFQATARLEPPHALDRPL